MPSVFELNPLFKDVQLSGLFPDGKLFVDMIPKFPLEEIADRYNSESSGTDFRLDEFVTANFDAPASPAATSPESRNLSIQEHIKQLWSTLSRDADVPVPNSTLIPLPYSYVVPGGRFREIYYWDSYFTMLGLAASGRYDLIQAMVDNFTFLIQTVGYIPNGNRTYYLGRSQPPFFAFMVELLAAKNGDMVLVQYLPSLMKEYQFWMQGAEKLSEKHRSERMVVRMPAGQILNRYWDLLNTPRPESYREDVALAAGSVRPAEEVYRDLRAAAASGWDFSSRWFSADARFESIQTTEVVPVDLNSLLYKTELIIARACGMAGDTVSEILYHQKAADRAQAIRHYCWDAGRSAYADVNWMDGTHRAVLSLAMAAPLFCGLAQPEEAEQVVVVLMRDFLKEGGLVTTNEHSGQQWDSPNGWAPLQWMAFIGLRNYGFLQEAEIIARNWMKLTESVFLRTGKLMEKYNVIDTHLEAGGGEYEGQDGFGWTNGVYLALHQALYGGDTSPFPR